MRVYQPVAEFYAGKSVFITGGAGYLGKVLIEKILYSCPDVKNIYILLRDKRDVSAEQRLKAMLDLPVFSRLLTDRPQCLQKIVLLKGDISVPNFNLKPDELATITEKVSIVIHSAASVKFNNPLNIAFKDNVEGTKNLLNLCHTMKNIEVFVHVSTAFSNTNRSVIEEEVYTPSVSIDEVYKLIEQEGIDESKLKSILDGRPNTYTLTKALAEKLVADYHGDIPTVIIRPSIVTPSIQEPVQGWVDNWYGSTGILTFIAQGICRVVYTSGQQVLDIVPVDYVCNLTLVAATRGTRQKEVSVYNSCSSFENPINIKTMTVLYNAACVKDEFNLLPIPNLVLFTKRRWLVKTITLLMVGFAHIVDLVLRFTMKSLRLSKMVSHSIMIQNAVEYFTINSWIMKTDRTRYLIDSLSSEDRLQFPCDVTNIDWKEYMPIYYAGVKKYLIGNRKVLSKEVKQ